MSCGQHTTYRQSKHCCITHTDALCSGRRSGRAYERHAPGVVVGYDASEMQQAQQATHCIVIWRVMHAVTPPRCEVIADLRFGWCRQLLGMTIASAVGMALFGDGGPARAVELPNPETAGNRSVRFTGGIKKASAARAAREAELKEKIAALKANAK